MNKLLVLSLALAVCGLASSASVKSPRSSLTFDQYWNFDEINEYLEELVRDFPLLSSIEQYGTTSEGRPIRAFVVRRGSTLKPTVVIESGLRAREWLSVMASMYIIHEIVEHDYEFDSLLDNLDFVFIPVANPDGFVFSHTTNRDWVKNRRPVSPTCIGADVQRNFQYQFQGGNDPCSDNYPGPFFHSEAESQAIRNALDAYQGRVVMYLSLQSTGQQILIPFNYLAVPSAHEARLLSLANRVADAIRAQPSQRSYALGVGGSLRGIEHGHIVDYTHVLRQIIYTYSFRLPSGGPNGWDIPEAQLSGLLSETFAGFEVFAEHATTL